MLAIALIVFREVLEAALIVGIVLAASHGVPDRTRWVGGGVAAGAGGAGLVAIFAASIADAFHGAGQEILNASVLILAVGMLAWHNIWMARHARDMAREMSAVGRAVAAGNRPLIALTLITGAAVLREGAETVLFVFSIAESSPESGTALIGGGLLGLLGGIAAGAAIYRGLLRIPVHRLFTVTGWLVLLLAAGLASQAAGFLVQADLLPALRDSVWDTSSIMTENSILGRVLHTLIGYTARPSGIQIAAYLITLAAIGIPARLLRHAGRRIPAVAVTVAGMLGLIPPAAAELKVRMPTVEYRELEFEHNGLVTFSGRDPGQNRAQSYTNAIGYGVTPWWKIEVEGEMSSGGGKHLTIDAATIENYFQLTEPGQYFFNLGFFAEYSQVTVKGEPNAFKFGPMIQKELPDVLGVDTRHTLNLFVSRGVGPYAVRETGFDVAFQSVALLTPLFAPGFEYYGTIENLGHASTYNRQQHFVGPVLTGAQSFSPWGKLKYEVGYQFGLTTATPNGAIRWKLEYEIVF